MANKLSNKNKKSNRLRAAVMGSNDGILSISGLVIGIASAGGSKIFILTAGLAGIAAGAISMAAGEYISVSAERDNEQALLHKENLELRDRPQYELNELATLYKNRGLKPETALAVAKELTSTDALLAHSAMELNIDPQHLTNPWHSVFASALSYTSGATIPLIAIMLPTGALSIPLTFISVIFALILTGYISAKASGSNKIKSILRVVACGVIAMAITFSIGKLFKVAGI